MTGKFFELVDALRRKKVDIACFQETKWKGSRTREGNQYKLWYSGSTTARNGVGVALAPDLKDKVVQVIRISDRIMLVSLVIEEETINVISAYAPQVGLGEAEKKNFWDSLDDLVRVCSTTQQLIIAGDLNGHIGENADGFSSVHGDFGYGVRNDKGRTILEFAATHDLAVINSFFKKRDVHLITFHNGDHDTQIDYMLVRKGDLRLCKDCKKYLYGEAAEAFRATVIEGVSLEEEDGSVVEVEKIWNRLANTIKEAAKETRGVVAGTLRTRIGHRESWWISDEVQDKVKAKQTRFRELISLRGEYEANKSAAEERYKEAKREAKKAEARAKEKAYEDLYKRLDSKEGRTIVNEGAIRRRWKEYFFDLFNGQRSGRTEELDSMGTNPQYNCYCSRIRHTEVKEALRKMGRNKAVGPDEIPIEALKCLGGEGVKWLTTIFNKTFLSIKMPGEWRLSEVIPIYKNKGDAQSCSNYRGIKLLATP
ncbi:aminopeptidase M1 [Tanacetum coccineum]